MGWLGLDDTDHIGGGCTTHKLYQLLQDLPIKFKFDNPRLVRLWPFAKRRTRGNAAVCVEIITEEVDDLIKFLDNWWKENLQQLAGMLTHSENYQRTQYETDPGMVWFNKQPNERFYWETVSKEVFIDEMPIADFSWGGHGKIGATAAVAWPAKISTFEAIAWRHNSNILKQKSRKVDLSKLLIVDEDHNTFMSRDLRSKNILISPRGNCPVLFGLRAKTLQSAKKNCEFLIDSDETEEIYGHMIFQTNQATDDHLEEDKFGVVKNIDILPRGTVKIATKDGNILMAFAESGDIKLLAQWLIENDQIKFNGLLNHDQAIHLERLKVIKAANIKQRPICQQCDVRMKSMGTNQLVRCPKCRIKSDKLWDEISRVPPFGNWVQPPLDSRRHLTMPIEWKK